MDEVFSKLDEETRYSYICELTYEQQELLYDNGSKYVREIIDGLMNIDVELRIQLRIHNIDIDNLSYSLKTELINTYKHNIKHNDLALNDVLYGLIYEKQLAKQFNLDEGLVNLFVSAKIDISKLTTEEIDNFKTKYEQYVNSPTDDLSDSISQMVEEVRNNQKNNITLETVVIKELECYGIETDCYLEKSLTISHCNVTFGKI